MIDFIFFIWVLGWVFSLGAAGQECFESDEAMKIWYVIALVFMWPYYLGYCWLEERRK